MCRVRCGFCWPSPPDPVPLRGIRGLPIVGLDVVEVAPAYDHAEVTALAAANIAYDVIAMMAPHARVVDGGGDGIA